MPTELDMFLSSLRTGRLEPMARNNAKSKSWDFFGLDETDDLPQQESIFSPPKKPWWQKGKTVDSKELLKQINETYYKLINIPDVMAKRSEFEMSDTTAGPIKTPFGPEVGCGYFSINWMIQSYAQKVPFEFAKWEDTVEVVKWLQKYVDSLGKDLKEIEPEADQIKDERALQALSEAQIYYHMAKTFLEVMIPIADRLQYYYTHKPSREQMRKNQHDERLERIGLRKRTDSKQEPKFLGHIWDIYNRTN